MSMDRPQESYRVAIIGSGFSGIGLGMLLKRAGIDDFVILEKGDRVGGTWRENTYPGAACDSPSFAYCFSFEQKVDWSRKWAPQPEILAYIESCATKYGLQAKTRFNTEIANVRFEEASGTWHIQTVDGAEIRSRVLVSGMGQLNRPAMPDIEGLQNFRGISFHSAEWNHDFKLEGKSVGVIGNAASAIQFVPEIAKKVAQLYVFQRSANWMAPKPDREYSASEVARFKRYPWLAKLYRWWIWSSFEARFPAFRRNRFLSRLLARGAERLMQQQVKDPELRAALVPDYPVGAKRILISNDYFPALQRPNVELVTDPIARITEKGVVTGSGREVLVDGLILSTGFQTTSFLVPVEVRGLHERSLADVWRHGAKAHLGLTVSGFPNFFMMYGPNTNLGHNSIIFMLECQANYIVQCVKHLEHTEAKYMDVRDEAMTAFNEKLNRELDETVWAHVDHSWYKNADGKITNNWYGTTTRYWWDTRRVDFSQYRLNR